MIDPVDRDFNRYSREVERMDALAEELEHQQAENAFLMDRVGDLIIELNSVKDENVQLRKRLQDDLPQLYNDIEKAKCDSFELLEWR